MELDAAERLVVEHEGGPLRVLGGFGSGKSAALRARADRLRAAGRRPLLVQHGQLVDLAVGVLARHGRRLRLIHASEQARLVRELLGRDVTDSAIVAEIAGTLVGFQASFLGDEELRVHADAAGVLDRAEELIALSSRYLAALEGRGEVDVGGALVQASLLLRDPAIAAAEQARFDELLVDDFQLASFATNRLVTQLVGRSGDVVVAGNPEAAVSTAPLASSLHLERFDRRFDAPTIALPMVHRVAALPPELRLVDDVDDLRPTVRSLVAGAATKSVVVIHREGSEGLVGQEAEVAVVEDASAGSWPTPRPVHRWFDDELFHGPDVPDDAARDRQWNALELRRFLVATTRATTATIVVARTPISPFVRELLR